MKRKIVKRFLICLMITAVAATSTGIGSIPALAAETTEDAGAEEEVTSGKYGAYVTWNYDKATHTLTLEGTGGSGEVYISLLAAEEEYRLNEYGELKFVTGSTGTYSDVPWSQYRTEIEHVKVGEGVTAIGCGTFLNHTALKDVSLPESLKVIEYMAFRNTALESVTLPSGIRSVWERAFACCSNLKEINVEGHRRGDGVYTEDGVLYHFNRLRCYPGAKEGDTFIVPEWVKGMSQEAIWGNKYLDTVVLHKNLTDDPGNSNAGVAGVSGGNAKRPLNVVIQTDNLEELKKVFFQNSIIYGLYNDSKVYVTSEDQKKWLEDTSALDNMQVWWGKTNKWVFSYTSDASIEVADKKITSLSIDGDKLAADYAKYHPQITKDADGNVTGVKMSLPKSIYQDMDRKDYIKAEPEITTESLDTAMERMGITWDVTTYESDLKKLDVQYKYEKYTYTGKPIEPKIKDVTIKDPLTGERKALTEGVDYRIEYYRNTNVHNYDVHGTEIPQVASLRGIGEYSGAFGAYFDITPQKYQTEVKIDCGDGDYRTFTAKGEIDENGFKLTNMDDLKKLLDKRYTGYVSRRNLESERDNEYPASDWALKGYFLTGWKMDGASMDYDKLEAKLTAIMKGESTDTVTLEAVTEKGCEVNFDAYTKPEHTKGFYYQDRYYDMKPDYYASYEDAVSGKDEIKDYYLIEWELPLGGRLLVQKGMPLVCPVPSRTQYVEKYNVKKSPALYDEYTFRGFRDSTGKIYKEGTIVNSDLDLEAYWEKTKDSNDDPFMHYTLTFSSFGKIVKTTDQIQLVDITGIPTLKRTGYEFLGWFTQEDGGEQLTENGTSRRSFYKDTTVYAHWKKTGATITFDPAGGSKVNERDLDRDAQIGSLSTPKRTGYTFLGWYTKKNGGTKITESSVFKSDTTLYAQWKKIKVKVSYNANGGQTVKGKTIEYGDKLGKLPAGKRAGYTFLGWYTKKSGGTKVSAKTACKADTALYAQWKKVTVPKAKISSLKKGKHAFTVKFKKISGAKGYQIRYASNAAMKKAKAVTLTKTTYTAKKVSANTYYVQVRGYKKDSAGKNVYGSWSKKASVKVK